MATASTQLAPERGMLQNSESLLSFGMLGGLIVMLVPLPPVLLDAFWQ